MRDLQNNKEYELTLKSTVIKNQILVDWYISYTCTYNFLDPNTLEIDDSSEENMIDTLVTLVKQ